LKNRGGAVGNPGIRLEYSSTGRRLSGTCYRLVRLVARV
jgi:hypothetical protein